MKFSAFSPPRLAIDATCSAREKGGAKRRGRSIRRGLGQGAFTLLELLTVITIIGILAALIFPSVGAARKAANRAKTKVQFSQWVAAIESFRSEYGYYPTFDASNLVNGGAPTTLSGDHLFHDLLAGKKRDGTAPGTTASTSAGNQNRKRIAFHSFGDSEFTAPDGPFPYLLRDAFENLSIAVLVDKNLDGKIDATDYATFPAVALSDGTTARPTAGGPTTDFPASGVRAGAIFYCAHPHATSAMPEFIFSWK
ncbi:MAG: prepilin-type cleavage/methylation domain-containing protein [Opitutus sp.]|nr:prepilin-type cleavage/methylation domain-containing protein [Opitutus sp.]